MDEEYAVAESPERAVTRPRRTKERLMKARLLRAWGGQYAGQIMSNVKEGDYPSGVAEYFEDDDPAIVEVREPGRPATGHAVKPDGTVDPLKGSDWEKLQQSKVAAVQKEHDDRVAAIQQAAVDKEEADKAAAEQGAKEAAKGKASVKAADANVPTTDAGKPAKK